MNCKSCGKKVVTKYIPPLCRYCKKLFGENKEHTVRVKVTKLVRKSCDDVKKYESEIKRLATKVKHNLLTPIDPFRICDIFIAVTCDETKYAALDVDMQCRLMIKDLVDMLTIPHFQIKNSRSYNRRGRAIVKIEEGVVIEQYASLRHAQEKTDYPRDSIKKVCNGGKVRSIKEDFRWARDFNI